MPDQTAQQIAAIRPHISEAMAESRADRVIHRRLETDRAYRNAEDAESQAAREAELTAEVWADLEARYIID